MNRAPLKVRVMTLYEVTLEYLRKKLPIAMLITGCFTIGYAVKNTEDLKDRQAAHYELDEQRRSIAAECDARIVQNDKLMQDRMTERDHLLSDQTQRIADLEMMFQDMENRQRTNHSLAEKQFESLKKLTNDTKESVQKEVTAKDRQVINTEVRAKK